MPEQSIIIKFQAQGNERLIRAIERLDKATKSLQGNQSILARTTDRVSRSAGVLDVRNQRLTKTNNFLALSFATLRSRLLLFNFLMGLGGRQLLRFTTNAAKVQSMKNAFTELQGSTNASVHALVKLKKATNNTMSEFDIFQQSNNAMILGITKNADEMAEMFDVAQRLGRALGRDTTSSVESLITGIGRQSRLMLDNIGIIVDTEQAYKTYAKELGKSTDKLTDQEKKQAFLNATMESARDKVKGLGKETLTASDNFQIANTAFENTSKTIGELLEPLVASLARKLASAAESSQELFKNVQVALQGAGAFDPFEVFKRESEEKSVKDINNELKLLQARLEQVRESQKKQSDTMKESAIVIDENAENVNNLGLQIVGVVTETPELIDVFTEGSTTFKLFRTSVKESTDALAENIESSTGLNNVTFDLDGEIFKLVNKIAILNELLIKMEESTGKTKTKLNEETIATKLLTNSINSMSSALANAALNGDHMGRQIEKALKRIAAQILAKAGVFALLTAIFPTAAATAGLKGVNPFAFALGLNTAHTGGLIKDNKVQKFATGGVVQGEDNVPILAQNGEFVMSRNAVESVGIETMNRINQTGSAGVTVNVSGNVMSQDFVEGELAERIKEAVRKGSNFGMS